MKNPVYDPGELDQLVNIVRQIKTPDGQGGNEVIENVFIANLWCKIKAGSPRENTNFDQIHNVETITVVIRYRNDILESDLIVWEGVRYNIRAIPSLTRRHRYLEIQAERGVGP